MSAWPVSLRSVVVGAVFKESMLVHYPVMEAVQWVSITICLGIKYYVLPSAFNHFLCFDRHIEVNVMTH